MVATRGAARGAEGSAAEGSAAEAMAASVVEASSSAAMVPEALVEETMQAEAPLVEATAAEATGTAASVVEASSSAAMVRVVMEAQWAAIPARRAAMAARWAVTAVSCQEQLRPAHRQLAGPTRRCSTSEPSHTRRQWATRSANARMRQSVHTRPD